MNTKPKAHLREARELKNRGENRKAIEAYEQHLESNPEDIQALNEMGRLKILIGRQDEAIRDFDKAIGLAPQNPDAHANKAEAYLSIGDFENALKTSKEGLSNNGHAALLWKKKAGALESMMQIDGAIKAYKEALKSDSSDPSTWKALALCFDAKQKWDEVARSYRIAANLHENRGEKREAERCRSFAEQAEDTD
ncbi:MAG: tetratricopeptide repeat protein [Candidatus Thorarchaeota archaeon]